MAQGTGRRGEGAWEGKAEGEGRTGTRVRKTEEEAAGGMAEGGDGNGGGRQEERGGEESGDTGGGTGRLTGQKAVSRKAGGGILEDGRRHLAG